MKKLSILLFALSELNPCVVCASSDDEIRTIVKPCIDKIVSSVEGKEDSFSDDDLIKCASDLTRQNDKISISKAIAIVGFYAGEAYKPNEKAKNKDQKDTYATNMTSPRTESPKRVDGTKDNLRAKAGSAESSSTPVMSPESGSRSAVTDNQRTELQDLSSTKAVVVSANRLMTDYEINEEKADDVYKDRRLCIKGKISKISVLGDEPFVEMSADSYGLRNVKFTLDKSRVEVLDSLQVGDIKVIEGTVVGYTLFKVSVTDPVLY